MTDNIENANPPSAAVLIRDYFKPVINAHYSDIARGTINANNFELEPGLINMVQQNQFGGGATADPHLHLRTFLEIADTVKINNVSDNIIRLCLFPFSLRDQAKSWLQSLLPGSITTWTDLATKFLAKYFPPAKSAQMKIEISTFRQTEFEQLYEAWERFKDLLRRCPNHNFADWVQIEFFYNGLNAQARTNVDAAAGGTIFAKTPEGAYDLIEQITINSFQWPNERSEAKKPAGMYSVDPITTLTAQVSSLATQIAAMSTGAQTNSAAVAVVSTKERPSMEETHYLDNRGYAGYRSNQVPNQYHTNLRNHENFSYANNMNALNPHPGFNNQNGEGKLSFEDLVGTFVSASSKRMEKTESRLDSLELHVTNMGATLKSLEMQIGQLTSAVKDQHIENEKNFREINAISVHNEEVKRAKCMEEILFSSIDISLLPYPQRFMQLHVDSQKKTTLEDFKSVHSNIQSADIENSILTEGCNEEVQRKLPQKLEDPGKFTVPCTIGGHFVGEALCDLGASVNVLPNSLCKQLKLTEVKSTGMLLQLTDKSVKVPCGVVKDVVVAIGKLWIPADFVVLDIEEDLLAPIILRRLFLTTAEAKMNVRRGKLTMEVDGKYVEFNMFKEADNSSKEKADEDESMILYEPP